MSHQGFTKNSRSLNRAGQYGNKNPYARKNGVIQGIDRKKGSLGALNLQGKSQSYINAK